MAETTETEVSRLSRIRRLSDENRLVLLAYLTGLASENPLVAVAIDRALNYAEGQYDH